jgi:hypothetical protein
VAALIERRLPKSDETNVTIWKAAIYCTLVARGIAVVEPC